MRTIAFFNDKGGVGTTSLVYHLAWMYAELDVNVVAADLDPQADLTSMFLADERLEALWGDEDRRTVFGAVRPLMEGGGDVTAPHVEQLAPGFGLVAGQPHAARAGGAQADVRAQAGRRCPCRARERRCRLSARFPSPGPRDRAASGTALRRRHRVEPARSRRAPFLKGVHPSDGRGAEVLYFRGV